jgi:hypothetical protein
MADRDRSQPPLDSYSVTYACRARMLFRTGRQHLQNFGMCGEVGSAYRCTELCLEGCGRSLR